VKTFLQICLMSSAIMLGVPGVAPASAQYAVNFAVETPPQFAEPFVRTRPTTAAEDNALSRAIGTVQRPNDYRALELFLATYPNSGWATAAWTNLGIAYLHDGFFSRALDAWQKAWDTGRSTDSVEGRVLTDRAVGELARLGARLGRVDELRSLFSQLGSRAVSGPATEAIQVAREQLTLATSDPRHLFNCGPLALRAMMLVGEIDPEKLTSLQFYNAGTDGTNLAELSDLANALQFRNKLVRRLPGQPVPIPSVVHWKVGHFAAIVGKSNGRYRVKDAVFGGSDIWVTEAALDSEASGFFLVPDSGSGTVNTAWTPLDRVEAAQVIGRGPTDSTRPGGAGDISAKQPAPEPSPPTPPLMTSWETGNKDDRAPNTCPTRPGFQGLCAVGIKESSVSTTITDTPVGYTPPIGPPMTVTLSYNQREDSQPANFNYFNISQKWSLNWSSYVIDDPANLGANVSRLMGEGGAFYYTEFDPVRRTFASQDTDGSILSVMSTSPVRYQRLLRDGTRELYEASNGALAYPRKVFLSKVTDPQGNSATLHYDAQSRLTSITDATGRDTTFRYDVAGRPLLISKITDPFGRSAALSYDGQGRLSSITDVIGLTSSFTYDANSLIRELVTPYGTTTLRYTAPGTASPPRFAQITDPLGNKEREEWLEPAPIPSSEPTASVPVGMPLPLTNGYLTYRNSFHWDKSAYIAANCTDTGGCDYTKARIRHFVHMPGSSIKGTALESEKQPLENRVWYTYPGQSGSTGTLYAGTYAQPSAIGRVLDDGSPQISEYGYDASGNLTQETDPFGRTTYYSYSDGINLAAVSQADEDGARTILAQYIYNKQRRPVFFTDGSGQTSRFEYNAAGQVTALTNALGEKTTYQYDAAANLTSVTNANNEMAATYTYDESNRVLSFTDSEGWSVSYEYDDADRLTKITYPDGTSARYSYERLDLVAYRDREGRSWQYHYDANRRLTAIIDPMHQTVQLGYDPAGNLSSLTDPKGNVTTWGYDIQNRQTSKTYADNTTITYTYETTTSRLKSALDALGQTKQYAYAIDDNLSGLTYLNAANPTPNVTFTYDPYYSRLASMADGVGVTTYAYTPSFVDGAQQLAQECFTAIGATNCSHTITYGYDALGRSASRQISGSGPETFQYDAIGRVINHSSDLGAFQLSYLGQTQQLTVRQLLPVTSTLKTTWSYLDNTHDRRLSGISNTGLTAGQFTSFTFETTPENLITGITQSSDATVAEPEPSEQTISFNNVNAINDVSGQDYTYDANGNLTSDGERTYVWDAENRLSRISIEDSTVVWDFEYDGLGRRHSVIRTHDANAGLRLIWCGVEVCQSRNVDASIVSYLAEGEVALGSIDPGYYGIDQIGSVRRIFRSAQTETLDYDPWGVPLQALTSATSIRFAGMLSHHLSNLNYTWFRIYDNSSARWISRDPLEELAPTTNQYSYASLNPISRFDPLGLFPRPRNPMAGVNCSEPHNNTGGEIEPAGWRKCIIQICVAAGILTSNPAKPQDPKIEDAGPEVLIQDPTRRTTRRSTGDTK